MEVGPTYRHSKSLNLKCQLTQTTTSDLGFLISESSALEYSPKVIVKLLVDGPITGGGL